MRRMAFVVAMAILLPVTPGKALDATGTDIIGLRLGMPERQIVAVLQHQGFAVARDHGALTARTRDGQLTIDLAANGAVRQIRYVFTGHGAGEPQTIRASMLDRFGPPDQAIPMAWCQAARPNGTCPASRASLTFRPETLTLVLRAGTRESP